MTTATTSLDKLLDDIFDQIRIPRATYRVQFNPNFQFRDAQNIVSYLHKLGISDLYTSPIYQPREGSTHGYDTVNYNQFNPALGTEDDFNALVETAKQHDISLLLDIVPNHMGIGKDNNMWMDVLKHGPSSVFSHYFDIDWQPENRALDNKVLLPVLGDHYGRVLEAGHLELVYWHGDFYLHYYENQYPITPDTYANILEQAHIHLTEDSHPQWVEEELASILTSLQYIPPFHTRDTSLLKAMRREQKIARNRFVTLYDNSEQFRDALDSALRTINGTVGDPDSFNLLDEILENQPYRLAFWRVASDEINYRRFFNINDMAAIRIEHDEVFRTSHQLTFRLLGEEKIRGLRIDHPDGLWNPKVYFQQLQEEYVVARLKQYLPDEEIDRDVIRERLVNLANDGTTSNRGLYILVEKILSESEPLPDDWAVYGTTGYDFMIAVTNLFVDPVNEEAFDTVYHDFLGQQVDFHEIIDRCKKFIMDVTLNSELYARSSQLFDIVEQNRRYRGFTRHNLEHALTEITAALTIYRTYINADEPVSERDRYYIDTAVELAKQQNPRTPAYLFDFIRQMLLMQLFEEFDESLHENMREFVMQYQQMTGPVMAKSVEDTAFYIYNRLTSLNEVGGHPDQFGITINEFHHHNANKKHTQTMLSTSTHDTKRSEDVRARISVLSEIPDEWRSMIQQWARILKPQKAEVEGAEAPSSNDEYLLYQTLVGSYPLDNDPEYQSRVTGYMEKAINEAKVHSNWVNSNEAYHQAISDSITFLLSSEDFLTSFEPFQDRIILYGFINSLATVALKLTSPGVPDIYQGNEMWRFSLVDPDNRRPVDYEKRNQYLDEMLNRRENDREALIQELVTNPEDGRIKLYLTASILRYRAETEPLFRDGDYIPLDVTGNKANHLCAYLREDDDTIVLVAVPRLVVGLTDGQAKMPLGESIWEDTKIHLPEGVDSDMTDLLTGTEYEATGSLSAATLFGSFPVVVLTGEKA